MFLPSGMNNFHLFPLFMKIALYFSANLLWIIIFLSYNDLHSEHIYWFAAFVLSMVLLLASSIRLTISSIKKMDHRKKIITVAIFLILYFLIYKSNLFSAYSFLFPTVRIRTGYPLRPLLLSGFYVFCSIYSIYLLIMICNNVPFMPFTVIVTTDFLSYSFLFIGMGIFSNQYKYISLGASSDHWSCELPNLPYSVSVCLCLATSLIFFFLGILFLHHFSKGKLRPVYSGGEGIVD